MNQPGTPAQYAPAPAPFIPAQYAPAQPGPAPFAPARYAPAQPGPAPFAPARYAPQAPCFPDLPAPAPRPRRSVGKIIAIVAVSVFMLGVIAVGALVLFGKSHLDEASVESEIVRVMQATAGVAPTDVHCPADIPVRTGEVTTCTATVEGQPITYSVRQTDDQGHLEVSSKFIVVDKIEKQLADLVTQHSGIPVTADCAGGKKVVVGGPGTTITCTVTGTQDSRITVRTTGTVNDQGTVDFP